MHADGRAIGQANFAYFGERLWQVTIGMRENRFSHLAETKRITVYPTAYACRLVAVLCSTDAFGLAEKAFECDWRDIGRDRHFAPHIQMPRDGRVQRQHVSAETVLRKQRHDITAIS
jgi:hypothetical protein